MHARIHFLNVGAGDCILLESNGRFALIDAGEDSDNPTGRRSLNYPGFEQAVCDYLCRHCADANGSVTLDFILGTHAHSDHLGGFDTILQHPRIRVLHCYLKPYHAEFISAFETKHWDNAEVYAQMLEAVRAQNVPLTEEFDKQRVTLGDIHLTFFNGSFLPPKGKVGENTNSVVTLAECGAYRVLLASDLNYLHGLERVIANTVGKVDVLKVGHHGYPLSTSAYFVKKLQPAVSIITNSALLVSPDVRLRLSSSAKSTVYTTVEKNGILLDMTDGSISFDIM